LEVTMKRSVVIMAMGLMGFSALALSARYVWSEKREATYVGMEKCKECHPEHVESYYSWKYSKNFRIIQMRKKDHDPSCLPCHVTGYGQPGGFSSMEESPGMVNKQCESCHGPASLHVKAPTKLEHQETLNVPRNICTDCHSGHKHPGY
jgi:nitrate/TMAO reductase-like tetraheme cytochrome c subunit